MKRIWKFLVMAVLVAVAGRSAQAGSYSDSPLSPGSQPSGTLGSDMLLAENTAGPTTTTNAAGQKISVPPESWTTDLQMGTGDPYHGYNISQTVPNTVHPARIFDGSGPTGTYAAGTAGSGQHTENTRGDMISSGGYVNPTGKVYQYIFHDATYDPTTGIKQPIYDIAGGWKTCP